MLSSLSIANVAGGLAFSAIFAYAIYTALGIRRTFSVGLYRSQALGIGLIALVEMLNNLNNVILSYVPPNQPSAYIYTTNAGLSGIVSFTVFYGVLFYWIDYSVMAAKKSDPLLRDTLHWQRARVILHPLVFASVAAEIVAVVIAVSIGQYPLVAFAIGFPVPVVTVPPAFVLLVGVPVAGVILLPISAWRTKDPLLKKQLYWFGLFAVLYLANNAFLDSFSNPLEGLIIFYALLIVQGYCLYRSAKSLVPLYSFSQEIVQKNQS